MGQRFRLEPHSRLKADLPLDHFHQRQVGESRAVGRLYQRTMSVAELPHTPRDYIDQDLGAWDFFGRFVDEMALHNLEEMPV